MTNLETRQGAYAEKASLKYGTDVFSRRSATAVFGVAAFAALSAIGGRIVIDAKPVPFTLQVFFVVLAGMVLGPRLGAFSQILYIGAGISGLPIFASPPFAGYQYLLGPTGGYLIGFVFGAYVTGLVRNKLRSLENKLSSTIVFTLAGIAGIATLYTTGLAWLTVWMMLFKQRGFLGAAGLAWKTGVMPFILVDTVKAAVAALFASGATLAAARVRT